MDQKFRNTYEDAAYADDYARLEWTGTYHLVRRELPCILQRHVTGRRALDFGCGTGRSTRLLRELGFAVTGVDIAPSMVARARHIDPAGDYVLLAEGDLERLRAGAFDLVLAAFPFDNTPALEKPRTFHALQRLLAPRGRIVNIVSTPELYTHEWVSFSTQQFTGNRAARDGDLVRSVTTQFRNGKPAEDVLCTEEGYRKVYRLAGLEQEALYTPLGQEEDGCAGHRGRDCAVGNLRAQAFGAQRCDHLTPGSKGDPVTQEPLLGRDPERYFRPPYVGPSGWVGIYLDRRPHWDDVADRLRHAYELAASPSSKKGRRRRAV